MKKLLLAFTILTTPAFANPVCVSIADIGEGIAGMQQHGISREETKRITLAKIGENDLIFAMIDTIYDNIPIGSTSEQRDFIIQEVWNMTYKACVE